MLVTTSTAPSYGAMRPLKPTTTTTFPVYHDLAERLAGTTVHPDDMVAHVLATCAGYGYSDADTVAMIMARMGLEANRTVRISETVDAMFICSTSFVVQSSDGRVVILCFRGTEPMNFINWLTDADLNPTRVAFQFPGQDTTFDMHGGFYRNVRATRYQIVTTLLRAVNGQSILSDDSPIPSPLEALYITGHSLGAAMAAIMAIMLVTDIRYAPIAAKLKAVYTYGQPMIGSRELASACNADPFLGASVIRYVYGRDVVPQLPPRQAGSFAHFGRELHNHASGDGVGWEPAAQPTPQLGNLLDLAEAPIAFVARQVPILRNLPFHSSLYDHGPQNYVAALTPPGITSEFGD